MENLHSVVLLMNSYRIRKMRQHVRKIKYGRQFQAVKGDVMANGFGLRNYSKIEKEIREGFMHPTPSSGDKAFRTLPSILSYTKKSGKNWW